MRLKRTVQGCFHEQPIGDGGDPAAIRVMPGVRLGRPFPDKHLADQVPRLLVFNKIDRVGGRGRPEAARRPHQGKRRN